MTIRALIGSVAIAAVVGCSDGTEPVKYGAIDSRITQGEKQTHVAGSQVPNPVIDLVFRNPLTGSVIQQPSRLERILLPKLAYALQAAGVNVKVQPNSVVCVGEEQTVLIPAVRCVNSDNQGNSRFDFLATTQAGTHRALIRATYGVETTIPDTVEIVVAAAPPAATWKNDAIATRASPAAFLPAHVRDPYDNASPYRIPSDARLTAQDTVLGSAGARTVTFSAASVDSLWRTLMLTGAQGSIAQFRYRLVYSANAVGASGQTVPAIQAVICGLSVNPCVSESHKP